MKEIWLRNNLSKDTTEILCAAYVISLVPVQFILDAHSEFALLAAKNEECKNFAHEVMQIISKMGSKISIVDKTLPTYNNVFQISEKQFDLVKKSKSPGQLVENLDDLLTERQKTKTKSEFCKIMEDTIHKLQDVPRLTAKAAFKIMHDKVNKIFKPTKLPPLARLRRINVDSPAEIEESNVEATPETQTKEMEDAEEAEGVIVAEITIPSDIISDPTDVFLPIDALHLSQISVDSYIDTITTDPENGFLSEDAINVNQITFNNEIRRIINFDNLEMIIDENTEKETDENEENSNGSEINQQLTSQQELIAAENSENKQKEADEENYQKSNQQKSTDVMNSKYKNHKHNRKPTWRSTSYKLKNFYKVQIPQWQLNPNQPRWQPSPNHPRWQPYTQHPRWQPYPQQLRWQPYPHHSQGNLHTHYRRARK
ncbi:uncharacterized protein LOC127282305 [Leptopilina boulardi]|uniref:uncharacterized protein LOC127282305 n=1 Tax=Leptopilina boulardi TaxID=63433 RepID=UPI0021F5B2BE|nr:uncharacterized protein LOC127282305 [Leptopilina boulardi]